MSYNDQMPSNPGYPIPNSGYNDMPPKYDDVPKPTAVTAQPQSTMVIQSQPQFREVPVTLTCPNCHQNVRTQLEHQKGSCTYLACFGICIVGCTLGCCLIPFCVDSCQDVIHRCPNCKTEVGRMNRLKSFT